MPILSEVRLSIGDISAYIAVAVFITMILGTVVAYFIRRRGSTGKVATSDAATLWAQSQEMRAQLLAEKAKAEDQRDRIMQIQTDAVIPVLTSTGESLKQILAALATFDQLLVKQDRIEEMLTEMHDKYIPRGKT
jgi:hypothetical protein